jgi:hypothetical protein
MLRKQESIPIPCRKKTNKLRVEIPCLATKSSVGTPNHENKYIVQTKCYNNNKYNQKYGGMTK